MAFPPRDPNAPKRPPKGKSKARRYALTWCNYTKDSTDETNHRYDEVSSTNVNSAFTALVKLLRERFGKPELNKPDVVLVEAALIPTGETLESFLGLDAEEE